MVSLRSASKASNAAENSSSGPSTSRNPRKRALFATDSAKASVTPRAKQAKTTDDLLVFSHSEREAMALACGQGDTGQLGLGETVTERKRFQPIKVDEKLVQIVCGGMHTVGLTIKGDVYTFGCNDESALGRKTEEEEENFKPTIVEIPTLAKIVQITAGDSHSAALDDKGSVFIWGIFRDSQGTLGLSSELMQHCVSPLKLTNVPDIVKIASGYNHLTMLSTLGDVYSVGAAEQGELGRVSKYQSVKGGRRGLSAVLEPGMVYFAGKQKTVDIWSFGYNSFFRSAKNVLFSCGLNNYGQTGTEIKSMNVFVPTKLKAFKDVEIVQVCGGDHHTLFLTKEGDVYSVGRGDLGRLGIGYEPSDPEYLAKPQIVPNIGEIKSIAAGSCVSFAVSQSGDLFAWGAGTNNQMGLGCDDDFLKPEKVSSKQLEDRKVIQVSAGGQHSTCLVVDKTAEKDAVEENSVANAVNNLQSEKLETIKENTVVESMVTANSDVLETNDAPDVKLNGDVLNTDLVSETSNLSEKGEVDHVEFAQGAETSNALHRKGDPEAKDPENSDSVDQPQDHPEKPDSTSLNEVSEETAVKGDETSTVSQIMDPTNIVHAKFNGEHSDVKVLTLQPVKVDNFMEPLSENMSLAYKNEETNVENNSEETQIKVTAQQNGSEVLLNDEDTPSINLQVSEANDVEMTN
ncbi:regulator of chromosome condensation-like [Convolutriloba macropyga]|uniref:regulator of chromosome condensation-like n=1 Tax=Convolutriloba macropyga TaxID=536237 RepID=UPI003F51AEB5